MQKVKAEREKRKPVALGEAGGEDTLVSGHFPGPISSLKEVQLDSVSCA